jgi:rhodanese-related sulfurtransferase
MSGQAQDIGIEELKKLQEDPSVLIVDVREKTEIAETGILPKAINIPRKNLYFIYSILKCPDVLQQNVGQV